MARILKKKRGITYFKKSKQSKMKQLLPKYKCKSEKKYRDTSGTLTDVSHTNYHMQVLNGIAQGVGVSQRIGNKINLKSILCNWRWIPYNAGQGNALRNATVRHMIVYDRESDGSYPPLLGADTSQAILSNTAGGDGLTAFPNVNTKRRYVILHDKVHKLEHQNNDTATGYTFDIFEKFKYVNTTTQYGNTGTNISDINSGAVYQIAFCGIVDGGYNPTLQYNNRVRYTDE